MLYLWKLFGKFQNIYIIKVGVCLFVCGHYNVRTLTSPPVLKLWDSQGYAWLSYDLMEVIKLIGERFELIFFFFKKILYVIPSIVLSFLPDYCHSFQISAIPSVLLSILPDFCHSFRIFVIPSEYCHSFAIFVILNSSSTLPYPKGEKIGRQRRPYLRAFLNLQNL